MSARSSVLVLFALACWPAASSAGPIEFQLYPTDLSVELGKPALAAALDLTLSPNPWRIIDSTNPVVAQMGVVDYKPWNLPQPAPTDIHPDGTTHWNNDGYFGVDVRVVDVPSGESALFHFSGRAHMYNIYSTQDGWAGTTYFWFQGYAHVTLGGNEYTIWGANHYESGSAAVNVWVGPDAPFSNTPEPGTLLLGAIALVPLGLRRLRR